MPQNNPAAVASPSVSLSLLRGGMRLLGHTAPGIAARVAEDLFMKPRRHKAPEREIAGLAGASERTITVDGRNIRTWSWGTGPRVVLVHGWEGRGSQLTPFVRPLLERGFSVVTFDGPGHGASDGNRSSLPEFAAAVRAVVETTNANSGVIAHSFGCAATTFAMHHGLQIDRVVFIAPPLDPAEYTERFGEILGLPPTVVEGMRRRIEKRFNRKWDQYSIATLAPTITAPLLVIHDRDDRETLITEGVAVAAAWPEARMIATEGLGHRRILREPSVVDAAAGFIAGDE